MTAWPRCVDLQRSDASMASSRPQARRLADDRARETVAFPTVDEGVDADAGMLLVARKKNPYALGCRFFQRGENRGHRPLRVGGTERKEPPAVDPGDERIR